MGTKTLLVEDVEVKVAPPLQWVARSHASCILQLRSIVAFVPTKTSPSLPEKWWKYIKISTAQVCPVPFFFPGKEFPYFLPDDGSPVCWQLRNPQKHCPVGSAERFAGDVLGVWEGNILFCIDIWYIILCCVYITYILYTLYICIYIHLFLTFNTSTSGSNSSWQCQKLLRWRFAVQVEMFNYLRASKCFHLDADISEDMTPLCHLKVDPLVPYCAAYKSYRTYHFNPFYIIMMSPSNPVVCWLNHYFWWSNWRSNSGF